MPAQRLLLEGDKPVRLGRRGLDVLIVLVERAGEVVGKDELMARVWADTLVEEGNLKFQVGAQLPVLQAPRSGECCPDSANSAGVRQWPKQEHRPPLLSTKAIGRPD